MTTPASIAHFRKLEVDLYAYFPSLYVRKIPPAGLAAMFTGAPHRLVALVTIGKG